MKPIRISLTSNWAQSIQLWQRFSERFSPNGDGRWKGMQLVYPDTPYDYKIILNTTFEDHEPKKSIVFSSEPHVAWAALHCHFPLLPKSEYLLWEEDRVCMGWEISLNYRQLHELFLEKKKWMSGVVSGAAFYSGHKLRVQFLQLLDQLPFYEHFGRQVKSGDHYGVTDPSFDLSKLKTYKGDIKNKEDGLLPYLYTFAGENVYEPYYYSEKILDPILCGCLTFYYGCQHLEDYLDAASFIRLDLKKPMEAFEIVRKSIMDNEYEKREPVLGEMKRKVLNDLNPLETMWKVVKEL